MEKWRLPTLDIVNYRKILACFYVVPDEGVKYIEMDVFRFDGIRNIFISANGGDYLTYKDILYWLPIPEIP